MTQVPTRSLAVIERTVDPRSAAEQASFHLEAARKFAESAVTDFDALLTRLQVLGSSIFMSPELYPPGVRDLAKRVADQANVNQKSLMTLPAKHRAPE